MIGRAQASVLLLSVRDRQHHEAGARCAGRGLVALLCARNAERRGCALTYCCARGRREALLRARKALLAWGGDAAGARGTPFCMRGRRCCARGHVHRDYEAHASLRLRAVPVMRYEAALVKCITRRWRVCGLVGPLRALVMCITSDSLVTWPRYSPRFCAVRLLVARRGAPRPHSHTFISPRDCS